MGARRAGEKGEGELTAKGRRGEESRLNIKGIRLKAWRGGRGEKAGGRWKGGGHLPSRIAHRLHQCSHVSLFLTLVIRASAMMVRFLKKIKVCSSTEALPAI